MRYELTVKQKKFISWVYDNVQYTHGHVTSQVVKQYCKDKLLAGYYTENEKDNLNERVYGWITQVINRNAYYAEDENWLNELREKYQMIYKDR